MAPPDSRREVGGIVWAKAEAVSKDCKRIYGAGITDKYILGTVLDVFKTKKNAKSKRATTYVKALYKFGDAEKEKSLPLQTLLAQDPKAAAASASTTAPPANNNNANPLSETGATNNNDGTAATTATGVAGTTPAGTAPSGGGNSGAASLAEPPPVGPVPVTVAHNRHWFDGNNIHSQINGPSLAKHWKMVHQWGGDELTYGCDNSAGHFKYSEYDCFMACFPKDQLLWMVQALNRKLLDANKKLTTAGELLKWFGLLILITRFEYGDRASLWSAESNNRYIPPPMLGRTGMPRQRFDELFQYMEWSEQPDERPEGMSSEQYRWMLVDDFVTRFNSHRVSHFNPSHLICVDESISRWYGLGGTWINTGLPFCVAIDRKPEDGCEIQNSCCARSGIMMRLKIVKSPVHEENNDNAADNAHLHGCNVLYELVYPWGYSDRIVVADSYFASVPAAIRMFSIGFRFIGVLKTSTREYPMEYLSNIELPAGKGDRRGLYTVDGTSGARLLAFVWCDRDRRYFITTCSNIQDGIAIDRTRWRQVDRLPNAAPTRVNVHVRQPRACEIHYSGCSSIDRHNRARQAGLKLEKKVKVLTFDKRINTSLLGMIVVDSMLLYKGVHAGATYNMSEREYYERLSEQLIDNTFGTRNLRDRKQPATPLAQQDVNVSHSIPSNLQLLGVTPTKRHKKNHPRHLLQGRCCICNEQTTHVCRECQSKLGAMAKKQEWICDKQGHICMGRHILAAHPDMVAPPDGGNRPIRWNNVV